MSTPLFVVQLFNGLQLGILLFLVAAGLTLVFGVMDFINLAHGVQYMLGAYLAVMFYRLTGSFFASRPAGPAGLDAVRPAARGAGVPPSLRARPPGAGAGDLRRHHVPEPGREDRLGRGAAQHADPRPPLRLRAADGRAALSRLPLRHHRARALPWPSALYLFVTATRVGMLVRAGATNAPMVSALGVDIKRLFMIVFGFGAMLAGFAGVMVAPILSVEPGMGDQILILAFVVIVIGGIGSIRGAFVAALLVGVIDTLGRSFMTDALAPVPGPQHGARDRAGARLHGDLPADGGRARGAAGRPVSGQGTRLMRSRGAHLTEVAAAALRTLTFDQRMAGGLFVLLALLPVLSPVLGGSYLLLIGERVMIFAIAALSLELLIGVGGLVSFGHAAFLGIGAYGAGIAASHGLGTLSVALPAALVASALFALATGAIAVRTRGVYFIMITLAFGQMAFFVATSLAPYGGDDGLTWPTRTLVLGTRVLKNETVFFYVILALLIATYLLIGRLIASRFGRVLRGLTDNETRMQAIGFTPYPYRLTAYVIAGTICGLAGFLLGNQAEFVSPAYMHWQRSGELIIMVLLGGTGTLYGPIVGALAFLLLEETLSRLTEHWKVILGPLLVLVVLFAKGGIAGAIERWRRRELMAPARAASPPAGTAERIVGREAEPSGHALRAISGRSWRCGGSRASAGKRWKMALGRRAGLAAAARRARHRRRRRRWRRR